MRRGRLAPLALLLGAAACFEHGPPVWAPNPAASGPPGAGCARARALRDRAPALLAAGRLDRTTRVLQRAEDLCPAEAPATWAQRVWALAVVGRSAEALQLATRIERSDRAGDADRAAAARARAVAEEHGRAVVDRGSRRDAPELFDPAAKRRAEAAAIFSRARAASRAGDHAGAEQLFLEAWATWHPDPRALVEAGLEASLAGTPAEAQALWDRAAYDDATLAIRPELSTGAPSLAAGAALAWSPDGARLAVGGDDSIVVFDAELRPTLRLRTDERVTALAFAASDGLLAAGLDGGSVRVFDAVTGTLTRDLEGSHGPVRALVAAPDGRTFAFAGDDGAVHLRDAPSGTALHTLRAPRGASLIVFDAAGARLATAGDDGRVTLWDTRTFALAGSLPARGGAIRAMTFAGDDLDVVSADAHVRWDVSRPRRPRPTTLARTAAASAPIAFDSADHGGIAASAPGPAGHVTAAVYRDRSVAILPEGASSAEPRVIARGGPIDALTVAPDGKTLAAAADGRVLLWRTAGDRVHAYEPGGARALAFSPDGHTLAVGLDRARIDLRDLAGGRPDILLETGGAVQCLGFSPDGGRLVAGTAAPSVQIFTAGATAASRTLRLEEGPVRSTRFSPDGTSVLIASKEGVTLWTPAVAAGLFDGGSAPKPPGSGLRFVPYGPAARDAAFTPDGSGMAVADERGELLFGKPSPTAPAPAQRVLVPAQIVALAIAPDGSIATAEGDRAVALRTPAGKILHRFRDWDAAMRAVAFASGHVAAGLGDGSVHLYRAPTEGPAAILRSVPGLGVRRLAGLVIAPGGQFELVGPDAVTARSALRCRLGAALYPLAVCAEQFEVLGLLSVVLAGQDPAEAEP